jgi:hypothetical protein
MLNFLKSLVNLSHLKVTLTDRIDRGLLRLTSKYCAISAGTHPFVPFTFLTISSEISLFMVHHTNTYLEHR